MMMFPDGLDEEQHNENVAILRAWETAELKSIAYTKMGIRMRPLAKAGFALPPAVLKAGLWPFFRGWTTIWRQVEDQLGKHEMDIDNAKMLNLKCPSFDYETAGGVLTRDHLKAVLTEAFPDDETLIHPLGGIPGPSAAAATVLRSTREDAPESDAPAAARSSDGLIRKTPAAKKPVRVTKTKVKGTATTTKRKLRNVVKKSPRSIEAEVVKKAVAATVRKAKITAKTSTKRSKTYAVAKAGTSSTPAAPQADGDDANGWRSRLRPRKPKA